MISAIVNNSLSQDWDLSKESTALHCLPRYLSISLASTALQSLIKLFPSKAQHSTAPSTACKLKLSLWHTSEERISEDIYIDIPTNVASSSASSSQQQQQVLLFPVAQIPITNELQDKLYERSVFLFMEITDFQVGIPYFIGSLRLAIGTIAKYQHLNTSNVIDSVELTYSGKAVDVSMQLKVNTDLHGYSNWLMSNKLLPQGIVNIEMTFCVGTTLSALTSRSMATLNKEHRQVGNYTLLRAFPQKLVDVMEEAYLPTDRIHISVEDLQMNKDMMDFYAGSVMSVRVSNQSSSEDKQYLYLGHVLDMNCTWLEHNELSTITPCEGLNFDIIIISLQESLIQENMISFGKLGCGELIDEQTGKLLTKSQLQTRMSANHNSNLTPLVSGMYSISLYTEIQSMHAGESKQKIKVGTMKIRVELDDMKSTTAGDNMPLPLQHSLQDLRQLYKNIEDFEQELILLQVHEGLERKRESDSSMEHIANMLLSAAVGMVTSYRQQNPALPNAYEHFFAIFDRIITAIVKLYCLQSNRYEHDVMTLHERLWNILLLHAIQSNAEEIFLVALHIYFQEWLTSDVVQALLELNHSHASLDLAKSFFGAELSNEDFCQREEERLESILKAVHMLVWTKKLLQRYDVDTWQANQQENLDAIHELEINKPMDKAFIDEVSEDLAGIFYHYRTLLVCYMQSYHSPSSTLPPNAMYLQQVEILQHASWITSLLHVQPTLLQKDILQGHVQLHETLFVFLSRSMASSSVFHSNSITQSYRIYNLIASAWQLFIREVYEMLSHIASFNGKHKYQADNPLSTCMEKMLPLISLLGKAVDICLPLHEWLESFVKHEQETHHCVGYGHMLMARYIDLTMTVFVSQQSLHNIYVSDMNISTDLESNIANVTHPSMVDDFDDLRSSTNQFKNGDSAKDSSNLIHTPKHPPRRAFFPPDFDDAMATSSIPPGSPATTASKGFRDVISTPKSVSFAPAEQPVMTLDALNQSMTPRKKDSAISAPDSSHVKQLPGAKSRPVSFTREPSTSTLLEGVLEEKAKSKVAEPEYEELTGTLLLCYLHRISPILAATYSSLLFLHTASNFIGGSRANCIEIHGWVQKALEESKTWIFQLLASLVHTNNITPKMMKKSIFGYYFNNVDDESTKVTIKSGVLQLLHFACLVDKLFVVQSQHNLQNIQQKIKDGFSKNHQDILNSLQSKTSLHAFSDLRKSLSYYYVLPSILYDLNVMRDFLSATDSPALGSSSNGVGKNISRHSSLSIEVEGPEDSTESVLLTKERKEIIIGQHKFLRQLSAFLQLHSSGPTSNGNHRGLELLAIMNLRASALDVMSTLFQHFWSYLHLQLYVIQHLVKSNSVVKDTLCHIMEESILTFSSLEASVSISHNIVGLNALRKGERSIASSTSTMSVINTYTNELFSPSYLKQCLLREIFQIFAFTFSSVQASPVQNSPPSNHVLYDKVSETMQELIDGEGIDFTERIETLKMNIVCQLLDNVFLIPFSFPSQVTDTLPLPHFASEQIDWRRKRSNALQEEFILAISMLQKLHWEKSFASIPVSANSNSNPIQSPLLQVMAILPATPPALLLHQLQHADLCIHELLQFLLVFHQHNINNITEVSGFVQLMTMKLQAISGFALQSPSLATEESPMMKEGFGKFLKLHGLATLFLDSFWSMLFSNSSVHASNQQHLLPIMKKVIEDHFAFKDLTSSNKVQVDNPATSLATLNGSYWDTFVHHVDHNSTSAFMMLFLFLLEFQHNQWLQQQVDQQEALASTGTSVTIAVVSSVHTVVKKEKELQYFRDALTLLLQSGHWELGLHLTELYKDIVKKSQDLWVLPTSTRSAYNTPSQQSTAGGAPPFASPRKATLQSLLSPKRPMSSFASVVTAATSNNGSNASSNSPKRTETIQNELKRVMQKFQEKLKLDGDIRLPTRYLAVRLVSTSPLLLDNHLKLAQLHGVAVSRIHAVNITNTQLASTSPLSVLTPPTNTSTTTSATSTYPWFEEWLVIRTDMNSSIACMHWYQDYLEQVQHIRKSHPQLRYELADLSYPLSFATMVEQLKLLFPDFDLVSPDQDLSQHIVNFSSLFQCGFPNSTNFVGSTMNFMQCYTACDAEICDIADEPSSFVSSDRGNSESKRYLSAEEDEEGSDQDLEKETNNEVDDIIRSNDLDDLFQVKSSRNNATKSIRKHLDKKFLHFDKFPNALYVYMASGNAHGNSESAANARGITRLTLSTYPRSIPVTKILLPQQDTEAIKQLSINASAFSPVASLVHWKSSRLSLVEACSQVLLHTLVSLDRMVKSLEHINALKATELSNQPHESILHTDNIFFSCYDILTSCLSQPSAGSCVGLHNVDFILTYETERNELRWQNVRKHAKREYMRQMSHYEETNSMKAIHEGGFSSKKSKNSLQRPDEPDLKSMKISFDQEAGLEGLEHLQLLRDAAMKRIIQSIKLMKQFIEKVSSLKVPQTTKFDAREHVRAKGRMSISVLHQVRNNQWGQHIQDAVDGVEPDEEITFPIDDEISLKQKCCLHIESLLAAIEIGVAL